MEQTNVINAVTHHNESVKSDIFVEACVFVGVKSCRAEYVRVRCTAGHNLYPTYVLAYATALAAAYKTTHIYFKSGFNEREEACAHSYGNILSEHLRKNALYHNLTCGIGEILINDKRFILEESALVTCVCGLVSVHALEKKQGPYEKNP